MGVALLETLIAAGVVVAMLSVAAPLVIRSARIWKQTQHYQFATDELSGQMDRLIALPANERDAALESLTVAPQVLDVLHNAKLSGKRISDQDGQRIELSLDWPRVGDALPITLVAWIDPLPRTPPAEPETVDDKQQDATDASSTAE